MNCRRAFRGFTLLEIILTLVILGLVATMGVSFFNPGVTRTDVAITQLQADASLQLVLENMIQDANNFIGNNDLSGFLNKLNNSVNASSGLSTGYGNGSGNNAYYYIANKQFVCPNANSFTVSGNTNQFLLVTIKPNASSGMSLTYIFGTSNNSSNVNSCGS